MLNLPTRQHAPPRPPRRLDRQKSVDLLDFYGFPYVFNGGAADWTQAISLKSKNHIGEA